MNHSSKETELKVVEMGIEGYNQRDIAKEIDISQKTVCNILNRYGIFKADFISKLKQCSGVVSMQYGLVAFHELTQRMLRGEKVQSAQLAVMGGIALSRGKDLLEEQVEIAPPDWSNLHASVTDLANGLSQDPTKKTLDVESMD